jgi:serine/threonine protein phosphatase PrpC
MLRRREGSKGERSGLADMSLATCWRGEGLIARAGRDSVVGVVAETSLVGAGVCAAWTSDLEERRVMHPSRFCEDDFRVEPDSGLAVVASGRGAIGAQGRPGAVLAAWSVAGEVAELRAVKGDQRLAAGFVRAHAAVERVTWSWRGPIAPATSAAAMIVDGERAWIAHVGTARVSRLTRDSLVPVTAEHSLARALAEEGHEVPAAMAEYAGVPTRSLGLGRPGHEHHVVPVRPGDWFLIASQAVHRLLTDEVIVEVLGADGAPDMHAHALLERLVAASLGDSVGFVVVGVVAGTRRVEASGGSRRPPAGWLFNPGRPLPEPPPNWRADTGSTGPDQRWFAEVAGPLMAL